MRGAPFHLGVDELELGIIPAYAGSTHEAVAVIKAFWDHPRVCGEHKSMRMLSLNITGSSPRMRGARLEARRRGGEVGSSPRMRGAHAERKPDRAPHGIIPAYAGSTAPRLVKARG